MVRIGDKPMMIYFVFLNDEVVYVGQTIMTLSQRKGKHLSEARLGRGSILGASIRKHGEDSFIFRKHSLIYNQQDADAAERYYISKYIPRYNQQAGGKSGYPALNKGKKETRPEVIQNIKDAAKNRKRTKRGPYSEKHINACREGALKKIRAESTPFICHNNGKIYHSKVDAGEDLRINPQRVRDVLSTKHKMKSYKGFTFSYVD